MHAPFLPPSQVSNYALMLLVEVAYELNPGRPELVDSVSLFMHVGVLGMDHPYSIMREHCKRLLVNLIHALAFSSQTDQSEFAIHNEKATITIGLP